MNKKKSCVLCIVADISADNLGGAEMHFVEVLKRLSDVYEFTLVVGRDTSIRRIIPKGIDLITVNYPKIPNIYGLLFITFSFFKLIPVLRQKKYDLVWAKQCYPQSPLAGLIKLFFKIPVYVTVQNPMLHKEELVLKGQFLRLFATQLSMLLTPVISWGLRQADLCAAVSRYSKQRSYDLGVTQVCVIPNGVDLSKYRTSSKKMGKVINIITTSALIPRNGIDILIRSVALLPKQVPWLLSIAGDGPDEKNLKKLTRHLGISKQVQFLGRVSNTNIPSLLSKFDVFIRPSRWEGFGVSFVEAMACGIPVIATPVGGITDFIKHRKTGLLAKRENPQSVAKQIVAVYTSSTLRHRIRNNALNMVKRTYNWDDIAKLVNAKFIQILNHHV